MTASKHFASGWRAAFSLLGLFLTGFVNQSVYAASPCKPVGGALMTNIGTIARSN